MAKIVTYHNPLDPISRETKEIEVRFASELLKDLNYDTSIYDVVIARNNEIVDYDFEITDEDIVAVILVPKGGGDGKNILRVVAIVAITVVANIVAPSVAGALGIAGKFGTPFVQGLLTVAGAYAVNAILPPVKPDINLDTPSQTYSWDSSSNLVTQGSALPKLFGTMKITPPLISKYIETINDKQYLNCLYALNDGELSSIADIKINGNPIANYDGVTYDVRLGTNDQSLIPSFDNTRYDQAISNVLETGSDWDYYTTQGNQVSKITLGLSFPRGLYAVDMTGGDAGSIRGDNWTIYAQYSNDGVNWANFPDCNPSWTYGTQNESAFRITTSTGTLTADSYTVRVRADRNAWPNDFKHDSMLVLEYMQEEIYDDFIYPNTALLAIRALATDQLSGSMPTVTCIASNGLSNPSLICQSILAETGVEYSLIDSTKFNEWQTFCTTKGYEFNGYFDSINSIRKILDLVSTCGRARVEQFGSKFSVIADIPNATPVQGFMFGMGNILKDSFKEEFLPVTNRANVIEITYHDKDNDYERTVIEVSNDTYDNVKEENRISIDFIGCTKKEMAIQYAKYRLNCNRYLTNTASWDADIDALVCRVGDVVQVSHDVPKWGYSGRIVSATATSAVLDRTIQMELGKQYYVKIQNGSTNEVDSILVTNSGSSTDTVHFVNALSYYPNKYDLYSFGEVNKVTKLMRIISITTSGNELRRKLTALEYNDSIYNDGGSITTEVISDFGVSSLSASDFIRYGKDGTIESVLNVTWNGESLYYTVKYKLVDDTAYKSIKVYDNFAQIVTAEGRYSILVEDEFGKSSSIIYTVIGKLATPDSITNLLAISAIDTVSLNWSAPYRPIDFSHFEVVYNDGYNWIREGITTATTYEVPVRNSGASSYGVYIVDTSNVRSELVSVSSVPSLESISNLTFYYQNGVAYIAWNFFAQVSGVKYEIRKGSTWSNSIIHAIQSEQKCLTDSTGTYFVKAYYDNAYGVRIYSGQDKSITIDLSRVVANVVSEYDDFDYSWAGSKTSELTTYGGYLTLKKVGTFVSSYGRYSSFKTITLSSPQLCHCNVNLNFNAIGEEISIDGIADFDSIGNIDGAVYQGYRIVPMISLSQDGSIFGDYNVFYSGDYLAKAFRFALDVYSDDNTARPIITSFDYSVDMPDRIESSNAVTSVSSSKNIVYSTAFIEKPSLNITAIDLASGDYFVITNETSEGFTVTFYDTIGTIINRTFNWIAKGY